MYSFISFFSLSIELFDSYAPIFMKMIYVQWAIQCVKIKTISTVYRFSVFFSSSFFNIRFVSFRYYTIHSHLHYSLSHLIMFLPELCMAWACVLYIFFVGLLFILFYSLFFLLTSSLLLFFFKSFLWHLLLLYFSLPVMLFASQ